MLALFYFSLSYSPAPATPMQSWAPGCKALWLLPQRRVALAVLLQPLLLYCGQHPGLPGWPPHPHDGGLHALAVVGVSAGHCALWMAVRGEGRTPKKKQGDTGLWEDRKHLTCQWGKMPGFQESDVEAQDIWVWAGERGGKQGAQIVHNLSN